MIARNLLTGKMLKFFMLLLLSGAFILTSCEEDDPEPDITITADAGTDATVSTGDMVMLDGSNSSISEGSLTYLWEFSSKPSGSSAIITDATSAMASFTADVEGSYVVQLTVTDGVVSDSDDITVTAESAPEATIEISGDITSDMVWTDHVSDPTVPDYLITGHTSLYAQLTIEENVLVHVQEDKGLWVASDGTIIANGTAGNEIVFTSSNVDGGLLWRGIKVESNSSLNKLEYTHVLYAGNTEFGFSGTDYITAIGIEDGKLSLLNSQVSNSGGYGIMLHSGEILDFSTNHFADNTDYSIRINADQVGSLDDASTFSDVNKAVNIYGSTLSSTTDMTWPVLAGDARYFVSGFVNINSYLEISPGAIFDFAEDKGLSVLSDGVLVANAAEAESIVFTSKNAATDVYWKGIYIGSNDVRNMLSNVEVSYAGNSEWGFGGSNHPGAIGIEDGKLNLSNSVITNSKAHGVYVKTGSFETFASNTFSNNGDIDIVLMADQAGMIDDATSFTGNTIWNGVKIYGSTLTSDATWVNLKDDARYFMDGHLDIEAGLTLDPGVYIGVMQDKLITVEPTGYLIAQGTSTDMITFTTWDVPGQILWGGIFIRSANAQNELDYVNIDYAGGTDMPYGGTNYITALGGDDDDLPTVTLTNSSITNSGGYAVYWEGGTINDVNNAGNTFTDNAESPAVVIP